MLAEGILSILSFWIILKSTHHSFSTLAFSISIDPNTNLFKPFFDQTIVLHKIFQCLPISLRAKSRVFTMNYKALHNLYLYFPSPLEPHFTLLFSSVSHRAPGTEISLLFLQFILHIVALTSLQRLLPLPGMIFFQISL